MPDKKQRRRRRIRDRIGQKEPKALYVCTIPGCGRPTAWQARRGLHSTICRYHAEFLRRHGSAHTRSLTGGQLRSYIRTAESVLSVHGDDMAIGRCLHAIADELASAGPVIAVGDLRASSAQRKARGVFARLRERGVPPIRILAIVIGALAGVEESYAKPGPPWAAVCVAKALKRRASGSHIVYGPGSRWDYYPESRGAYLPALGKLAIHLCAPVTLSYRDEVLAMKIKNFGAIPLPTRPTPFPRSRFGNERVASPPITDELPPLREASGPAGMTSTELERYAKELNADAARRGVKTAFDGKL